MAGIFASHFVQFISYATAHLADRQLPIQVAFGCELERNLLHISLSVLSISHVKGEHRISIVPVLHIAIDHNEAQE
eukprot:6189-Heterococcus_DN1.PRE.2